MRSAASSPSVRWCRSLRRCWAVASSARMNGYAGWRYSASCSLRSTCSAALPLPSACWRCSANKGNNMMSASLSTVSYIGAIILFILSLGGLSSPVSSRRGNLFGMIGMTIAVLATVFGPRVSLAGVPWIIVAMLVGGSIGLIAARVVKMTQMPELVALMHSLVGMAACLVGFANYIDPSIQFTGAEKAIHEIEIYIGILIGAVTFSGSVTAFGKLSGKI